MQLDGKTALVTGGASGIGKATVLELARCGARVICADINAETGAQLVKEAGTLPVEFASVDLADPASTRRCAAEVLGRHSRVDILVHAAGWAIFSRSWKTRPTTSTVWSRSISAEFCTSPRRCCRR